MYINIQLICIYECIACLQTNQNKFAIFIFHIKNKFIYIHIFVLLCIINSNRCECFDISMLTYIRPSY